MYYVCLCIQFWGERQIRILHHFCCAYIFVMYIIQWNAFQSLLRLNLKRIDIFINKRQSYVWCIGTFRLSTTPLQPSEIRLCFYLLSSPFSFLCLPIWFLDILCLKNAIFPTGYFAWLVVLLTKPFHWKLSIHTCIAAISIYHFLSFYLYSFQTTYPCMPTYFLPICTM